MHQHIRVSQNTKQCFVIIFINLTQHFTGYITCKHIYFEIFFSWYYDAKGEFIDMHTCRALQKQMLAQ